MDFTLSLLTAAFTLVIVFVVLITLYVLIRLFSGVISAFNGRSRVASEPPILAHNAAPVTAPQATGAAVVPASERKPYSAGIVKLNNVDEKTAAMIMAITSHEIGIPLSQLRFQSIRRIEE